jgi:hypothetical protein
MFEGLKKGFAQGKAEAAEQERKQKIKKYVAAEKKSIAERKKQIAAKPSATTVALGKIAYHAEKYAEPAGKIAGKVVSAGKVAINKLPEPPKQTGSRQVGQLSGVNRASGTVTGGMKSDQPYRVNNFVLGRTDPNLAPDKVKMPKPQRPRQNKEVIEIRHVYREEVREAKAPRQKKGPEHPWLMGRG